MSGATLEWPHVWQPRTGGPPLLLLHGTGGDEHDLLPLAQRLAPSAPVLAVRGTVLENGMPRFFRRLAEGVFDEADLRDRVDELAEFLTAAEKRYQVEAGSWTAIGFSNGANVASALLIRHPEALQAAVLLAAMAPFAGPPAVDLTGAGQRHARPDGHASTPRRPRHSAARTRSGGRGPAHDGGHTVDMRQLPRTAEFVQR
jgi:phospholipase/carboxylesterase